MTDYLHEQSVLHYSIITVIIGIIALSFLKLASGLSFLLGGAIGILAFRLICLEADKILKSAPGAAQKIARRGYLKRLLLYAAALTISIRSDSLVFGWAFIGLLIPKVIIYVLLIVRIIVRRLSRGN